MNLPQITKVPKPTDIGRVETGALQFDDDWPGLFLRGDYALVLMARIRILAERLGKQDDPGIWSVMVSLKELADLIDRDVKVRSEKLT
jgi:hypothetical protein